MPPQPRPLPPKTIDGLRPPRAGFPYFAHADHFEFQDDATAYSPVNAWWLADACLLVYGNSTFISAAFQQSPLARQSWKLGWLGTAQQNRGLVLSHRRALVIAFRGTRLDVHTPWDGTQIVLINQDDLWIDSQFLPAVCEAGGRVHAGFLSAFKDLCPSLDAVLQQRRPSQRLYLTGHSLGGALATLAAAHLAPAPVDGLYTYGCPRVGDATFAELLSADVHCRMVYGADWVPTLPPNLLGYVHSGMLHRVPGSPERDFWKDLSSSTSELLAALGNMASQFRLDTGELPLRIAGLVDHAPVYYATLLWNALLEQRQPDIKELP